MVNWWRRWRSPESEADRAERAVTRLLWERRFERVALLVLVTLYLVGFHQNHRQDVRQNETQTQITTARSQTSAEFCARINSNATGVNRITDYLQAIIVNGAKGSKPFERFYRREGFPPYRVRLAQAEQIAAGLGKLHVLRIDCRMVRSRIKESAK